MHWGCPTSPGAAGERWVSWSPGSSNSGRQPILALFHSFTSDKGPSLFLVSLVLGRRGDKSALILIVAPEIRKEVSMSYITKKFRGEKREMIRL